MNWVKQIFRRRRAFGEFAAEIRGHLEEKIEELVEGGMSPGEAEHAARREFGNLGLIERDGRAVWRWGLVEELWMDVRFGLRMLVKSPGFTSISVAALALGIGANTAIYTIMRGSLSWDMGLDDHERVVSLIETNTARSQTWGVSYPDYRGFQSQMKGMKGLAAYQFAGVNVSDRSGLPEHYDCAQITANGLALAGQKPLLGRDFVGADADPGTVPVVILGFHVWRDRYGQDPGIIGKIVRVDEISRTVIGVMPAGRRFPDETDIWTPLTSSAAREKRDNRDLMVFGRLADGASLRSARAEAGTVAARLGEQYADTNKDVTVEVQPIIELTGLHFLRPLFFALYGAVAFVLLIACADVANMLLARAAERSREISIRVAIGAGKARIVRQLLFENVALAAAGGFFGWLVALGGLRWFESGLGPTSKPVWLHLSLDHQALFYLAAISLGTAILFGLAPALQLAKTDVNAGLKDYGGHLVVSAQFGTRVSNAVVASQVALCVTLLAGGGLMIRSAINLYNAPIGVNTANVLALRIALPAARYAKPESWVAFQEALKKRVEVLPGVESMSVTSNLPLSGWVAFSVEFERRTGSGTQPAKSGGLIVGTDYFQTMDVQAVRGRTFVAADGGAGTPVALVNESFAAKFWLAEEALGKRIRVVTGSNPGPWLTVVGVVPDILQNSRQKTQRDPLVYLLSAEQPENRFFVVARTVVPPGTLGDALRREVQHIDENLAADDMRTLDDHIAESRLTVTMFSVICSIFAGVATMLAAIGLYGVVTHGVNQRRREIGLRMAIGAARGDVLRLVLTQALRPLLPGLAIGLLLAAATTRALRVALVGVSPNDPVTLIGITVVLVFVTAVACLVPARRATRVDPMVALRYE